MERHANYRLVGAITVALFVAALVFVFWFGHTRFASEFDRYRIVFQGPVRGLSEGGDVQFNGIKVGEIKRIELDPKDPNRVIARISLRADTPVRVDSMASTESQGIAGTSYVQITAGTPSKPLLREVSKDEEPLIRAHDSSMQSLLEGGGELVARASETINRVNRVLSDENINNFSLAIADVRATTAELRERRDMFRKAESMFDRLDRAAADIEKTSASVRRTVDGDGKRAFADISAAAADLRGGVADARKVIARLNVAAAGLAGEDGGGLKQTLDSLSGAAVSLEGLARQLQTSPRDLLSRPSGQERKIPQ